MADQGIIYSITCPEHKKIIYVGQTINFEARCKSYFGTTQRYTAIELYVEQIVQKGLKPIFTLHKKCDVADLDKEEYALLDKFAGEGILLLNRRNNKSDNYHSAREFYLGIKKPEKKFQCEIIDLTTE